MGELDFRLRDILIYESRIEQNIWRRKLFFCRGEEKRRRNIIFLQRKRKTEKEKEEKNWRKKRGKRLWIRKNWHGTSGRTGIEGGSKNGKFGAMLAMIRRAITLDTKYDLLYPFIHDED